MGKTSFKEIINDEKPTLIDFYADWCGPCKQFSPIIAEVKKEMGDKVKIIKIDVDKNQELSGKLGIRSIPTVMIYQSGKVKFQGAGVHTRQALVQELNKLL